MFPKNVKNTILFSIRVGVYLMVLAHFFIPHHHHNDFSTHFSKDSCHHEHEVDSDVSPLHAGLEDCEILNYTWVENDKNTLEFSLSELDIDFPFYPFDLAILSGISIYEIQINDPPRESNIFYYSSPSYTYPSLRAPPSILS